MGPRRGKQNPAPRPPEQTHRQPGLCLPLLRGRTQPAVRGCQQTPRRCRALSGGHEALAPGLQLSRISAGPCAGWFQHAPLCWGSLETARVLQRGRSCPGCAHAGADERRAWLAGRLHRPAELIPIDSRSPIVIPDDKERGGAGEHSAAGPEPSISPQPLRYLIRLWPRLKMSVAPGSGRGSFRVLYIALIYMSLEINLACILPHRPPPLRLPMPPSPPWPQPPSLPAMVQGRAPVGGRGVRWQLLGCGAAWHCHLAWDGLTAAGVGV